MEIILITITTIAVLISVYCINNKKQIDHNAETANKKIYEERDKLNKLHKELQYDLDNLTKAYSNKLHETNQLYIKIDESKKHLISLQQSVKESLENQTELSQKAFTNYCSILEKNYQEKENEYNILLKNLSNSYAEAQSAEMDNFEKLKIEINNMKSAATADLEKLKATRDAAIEAARREREIQEQSTFYCLQISEQDKADICKLNNIKSSLNKPRVLSMLEWSTFIQKPLKALGVKIVGSSTSVCGIYKITSLLTGECYIGQSVDVAQRWLDHGKCGMDIDRPQGNKLYQAMVNDGIWNFSWELLEECPRDQLDEKEKYYINLYDSCKNGYNSTIGNH